ncbi:MAG: WG repeat-containing protein [Flavobacteriaceae bacterium]|nr:WG repeat-containing protein [Flavobacteriaceae bacterium]
MRKIKNILFFSILVSLLYSCKVSEMVKIDNVSMLNGRYYTKSVPHKESQGEYQNHLLRLLNVIEDIRPSYYIDFEFEDNEKLKITYPIYKNDTTLVETRYLHGKKRRKYWEVYFENESVNIPFIYGRVIKDRVRIGKNTKNQLLMEKFTNNEGWVLFLGDGYALKSKNVFYHYKDYPNIKPFEEKGLWGAVLGEEIVVQPKYEITEVFEQKYIKAKINEKWSLLDQRGKEIIPPKYDDVSNIDRGTKSVFYVVKDEKIGIVNKQGEEITPIDYDVISEGEKEVFVLTQGDLRGVLFKQKILVPSIYESINGYGLKIGQYKNMKPGRRYYNAQRDGKKYVLDDQGNEYELEETEIQSIRKALLHGMSAPKYSIKQETARKVSLDEWKK